MRGNCLLTHLHYDHVLGTPFFPPMRDPGALLEIYGPSQVDDTLQATMAGMVKPPFFPVHMADFRGELRYHDLKGNDEFQLGGISVKVRTVPHIGNTLGFRIEADGASLAYVPDHQAPVDRTTVAPEVLELCEGVDLLIHDSQYTEDEFVELFDWGHSTPAYAVHVATQAGARRLDMFHHDPGHTDRQLDVDAAGGPSGGPVDRQGRGQRGQGGWDLRTEEAVRPTGARPFDPDRFKDAMGMVRHRRDHRVGHGGRASRSDSRARASSSLSIDPPYVAVAPARTSTSWPRIARSGSFCVNVLAEDQEDLCRGFAVSGGPKFDGVDWHPAPGTGSPVIDGSLAWVDCRVELVHDAGDHELILGRVHRPRRRRRVAAPLLPQPLRSRWTTTGRRTRGRDHAEDHRVRRHPRRHRRGARRPR